jgi:hypothetical protein
LAKATAIHGMGRGVFHDCARGDKWEGNGTDGKTGQRLTKNPMPTGVDACKAVCGRHDRLFVRRRTVPVRVAIGVATLF